MHNANHVAFEAGNSPDVIFRNYRELVAEEAAEKWFSVMPPDGEGATGGGEEAEGERKKQEVGIGSTEGPCLFRIRKDLLSAMGNRCSMTGMPSDGPGDGIWDDGDWISWAYINEQLEGPSPQGGLLEDMIVVAKEYYDDTGRHLPIYGELGEHYAARRFGIELHEDPQVQGSDGRIGDSPVEVKTISPVRDSRHVRVKASGNFAYLAIVKIDADFRIDAKLIKRKRLGKPNGTHFSVSWDDHRSEHSRVEVQQ